DEAQAVSVAHRLLATLAAPAALAQRELAVSASIGIVAPAGGGGDSAELIRHADVAMDAAKAEGRAPLKVLHGGMAHAAAELLGLEHDLRLALSRGELRLNYQPEVAIDGETILGAEALLRWWSPGRGFVSPAQFIPLAEANGAILAIGEFVLREACETT